MKVETRVARQRLGILHQLEDWLELPMVILGFVWLLLLILEFTTAAGPHLEMMVNIIWAVFIFDFLLKFALAPAKFRYLRKNWLGLVALLVPALRVFRIFRAMRALRAVRAARGIRLLRVVSSLNRGMKALGQVLGRRGFGYAVALTLLVVLGGSAGMFAFEREHGLRDYGSALWWTAMLITTMGSEYWPRSPEGRMLCFFLSLYAFAVFGYVTASLASLFVEQDAKTPGTRSPTNEQLAALHGEMKQLDQKLSAVLSSTNKSAPQ